MIREPLYYILDLFPPLPGRHRGGHRDRDAAVQEQAVVGEVIGFICGILFALACLVGLWFLALKVIRGQ